MKVLIEAESNEIADLIRDLQGQLLEEKVKRSTEAVMAAIRRNTERLDD